jgi:hypothetical protein
MGDILGWECRRQSFRRVTDGKLHDKARRAVEDELSDAA